MGNRLMNENGTEYGEKDNFKTLPATFRNAKDRAMLIPVSGSKPNSQHKRNQDIEEFFCLLMKAG